jgi:F0F1-type ATP synthase epsilon subunit
MNYSSTLTVVVRNKDNILFNGKAYAVTAVNEKGPFDVLEEHENFISLIRDKVIVHKTPNEQAEFQIGNGIVRVYKDKVYIYVNFRS